VKCPINDWHVLFSLFPRPYAPLANCCSRVCRFFIWRERSFIVESLTFFPNFDENVAVSPVHLPRPSFRVSLMNLNSLGRRPLYTECSQVRNPRLGGPPKKVLSSSHCVELYRLPKRVLCDSMWLNTPSSRRNNVPV